MPIIDLHVHSDCSDGALPPAGVVEAAREVGLRVIALTDHDTVDGIDEAIAAGERLGVRVIPGVEINTDYGDREVHILGYLMDYHASDFLQTLKKQREGRLGRNRRIIEKLREMGLGITEEQVLAIAGPEAAPGRPHVARALMEKGYVASIQEAFDKYLANGAPAYVPRHRFAPTEAVRMILAARGVPVLAHPGLVGGNGILPELVAAGLRGIEVFYPEHDAFLTEQLLKEARKRGLIATGGSDWHGGGFEGRAELGSVSVPPEAVEELEHAHGLILRGEAPHA